LPSRASDLVTPLYRPIRAQKGHVYDESPIGLGLYERSDVSYTGADLEWF